MTRMLVRLVTISPASGVWVATVGAMTLVGGTVTMTMTGGEEPLALFASVTTAVRMFVPNGAGQIAEYGVVASLANSMPFARNRTFATLLVALAVAVTSIFVGPSTMWPSGGAVIFAT